MDINQHKYIPVAFFSLAAALIVFAGVLVWYGLRTPTPSFSGAISNVPPGPPLAPPLKPGEPNPAEALSRGAAPENILSGKVSAIDKDTLTLVQTLGGAGDLSGPMVTIKVNTKTEIYKPGVTKSSDMYKKEIEEFQKAIQYGKRDVIYAAPDRYEHVKLTLADLAVGTMVVITPVEPVSDTPVAGRIFVLPQ